MKIKSFALGLLLIGSLFTSSKVSSSSEERKIISNDENRHELTALDLDRLGRSLVNNGKTMNNAFFTECPAPTEGAIYALCGYAGVQEAAEPQTNHISFKYERKLWKMSCADESRSLEEAKRKIKEMWNKYKETLLCDSSQSEGEKVSVLIHSLEESFPTFLYEFVKKYNIDIEEKIDGKTIYDYLDGRIAYLQRLGGYEERIITLRALKSQLKETVGTQKAKIKDSSPK